MGRPLPLFRSDQLLDPAEAGLREEDIAARTPLVLATPAQQRRRPLFPVAASPASCPSVPAGTKWTRPCLALRSASIKRNAGWWATREDWHQLELDRALGAAVEVAGAGYVVAVTETWVRCQQDQYGAGWSMASAAWAPAARWAWLADEVPVGWWVTTPGNTLVHLPRCRVPTGGSYGKADRRAWVTKVLT